MIIMFNNSQLNGKGAWSWDVRLFLLSFHNFHFIFSCGLQLNSCKVFFLWLVLVSFIFSRIKLLLSKLVSLLKDIKKKNNKKQANKQTSTGKCFPIHSYSGPKLFERMLSKLQWKAVLSSVIQLVKEMEYCTIHRTACENSIKRYWGKSLKFLLDKPLVTILLL